MQLNNLDGAVFPIVLPANDHIAIFWVMIVSFKVRTFEFKLYSDALPPFSRESPRYTIGKNAA